MKLNNELLPHEFLGVEKLKRVKVAALLMEQGTGKTITALELCRLRLETGKVAQVIWLCPCSAKRNIKDEIIKQAPEEMLKVITICGIETLSSSIRANVYLRNLAEEKKCYLVVDESLLVKNPSAYRTRNIIEIAKKCEYKVILNGTLISKDESDIYSQFYILDWRILGYKSFWSFSANHLEFDSRNKNRVIRCLNKEYLVRKIEPYSYQVKKDECLNLPSKIYGYYCFNLTPEQMLHYEDVADRLLFDLDEMRPETLYRLFTGLQAVACGRKVIFTKTRRGHYRIKSVPFFEKKEENPRLRLLLDLVRKGEKCIIFCIYQDDITSICDTLNEIYGQGFAVRFDGYVPMKKRVKNLQLFKEKATWLVANRNCAGYSLNLQFCHNIIYYSNGWDLATRLQSEDRVHRIGQTNKVSITDLFAESTIDERIYQCVNTKESLLESFKSLLSKQKDKKQIKEWIDCEDGAKLKAKSTLYDCSDLEDKKYAENI